MDLKIIKNSNNFSNLLQALIDHAQHSITIAEKKGDDAVLIYINNSFTELTGYTKAEALNRDCRFLQGKDRNQKQIFKLKRGIMELEPTLSVIRNYKKNGELFWNKVIITPFFDEENDTLYFIGEQKDVTDLVEVGLKLADNKTNVH